VAQLSPDTVLRRLPELSVRLHANDEITVSAGDRSITCGSHGLLVLDAFSRPRSFAEAVAALAERVTGAQDWVDLTATIRALHETGFLEEEGSTATSVPAMPYGFDDPAAHVSMLNDRSRTSAFLAGLREVVRPGDVVVDVGTGTGLLAVAAARAGARHVYAVEAGGIGRSARALFEENGLADRITLVEGWSHRVTLPERADVLVTETVGNDPMSEHILESTRDARRRLLNEDARFVPSAIRVFVLPVSVPRRVVTAHAFSLEAADRWRSWYGIGFRSLVGERPQLWTVRPARARRWKAFSDPVLVAEVELAAVRDVAVDATAEMTARAAGRINGLLVFFELQVSPSVLLSIHPQQADRDSSWRCPVWMLPEPLRASSGDRFAVSYAYRTWPEHQVWLSRI